MNSTDAVQLLSKDGLEALVNIFKTVSKSYEKLSPLEFLVTVSQSTKLIEKYPGYSLACFYKCEKAIDDIYQAFIKDAPTHIKNLYDNPKILENITEINQYITDNFPEDDRLDILSELIEYCNLLDNMTLDYRKVLSQLL